MLVLFLLLQDQIQSCETYFVNPPEIVLIQQKLAVIVGLWIK